MTNGLIKSIQCLIVLMGQFSKLLTHLEHAFPLQKIIIVR